jgi:PGF-CTERM protein
MIANSHGSTWGEQYTRAWSVAFVAGLVIFAITAGTGGASAAQEPGTFEVVLEENGDATVTITLRYDLSDEQKRTAFRSLAEDRSSREQFAADWGADLGSVAKETSEATGRQMTVADPTVTATTTADGSTGIVTVTVQWSNLAAVDGNRLRLSEPFASGFAPDRRFEVVPPEGHELETAGPQPTNEPARSATWAPGTSLSGLEVTAKPAGGRSDGSSLPGFGPVVAIAAVLVATSVAVRRS